jgi:hypothetical protein
MIRHIDAYAGNRNAGFTFLIRAKLRIAGGLLRVEGDSPVGNLSTVALFKPTSAICAREFRKRPDKHTEDALR